MRTSTQQLLADAIDLVRGADHVLANTQSLQDVNPNDCYDLAYKLEKARNLLLVIGDRKYQAELNQIPVSEGVPF
jgi:hypothetical protein